MISSITPSSSILSSMQSMRHINKSIETLQTQISTGKRINTAKDDPVLWSLAQGLTSEIASQAAVQGSLATAQAVVKTATTSITKMADLLNDMNTLVAEAEANNTSKTTLKSTLITYVAQIEATVNAASYRGQNLINGTITSPLPVLTNLIPDGTGGSNATYMNVANYNLSTLTGGDLASLRTFLTSFNTTTGAYSDVRNAINTVQSTVGTVVTNYASMQNQLDTQQEFLTARKGILENHLSSVVNIDEAESSAELSKLQTQKTLAESMFSLSLQQKSASILRLFGLA